jgi:hypothetical protein
VLESLGVAFPPLAFLVLASPVLADAASLVPCCLVLAKPGPTFLANPHALRSPLFSSAPASLVLASLAQAVPFSPLPVYLAPVSPPPVSPLPVSPLPVYLAPVYLGLASLIPTSPGSTNAYHPPLNSRRLLGARWYFLGGWKRTQCHRYRHIRIKVSLETDSYYALVVDWDRYEWNQRLSHY